MYESITYEIILKRMLDAVPDGIDKREGSIIYNALAPAAVELQNMYIQLDAILNETFADTASRDYLIKRTAERGITPNPATKAILKGIFNIDVEIGSRFSLDILNYVVIEKIDVGEFKLECETYGNVGNGNLGTLIPIDYIDGLTSAELTEVLIPGEDEEETETLRNRYFANLESPAFGGNIADYKVKVNLIPGVGGVKVTPAWAGGGTVLLKIITSDYDVANSEFVDVIQELVDPIMSQGFGLGIAPIGHVVTVQSAYASIVNINLNITYGGGWNWATIQSYVNDTIDAYFLELKKEWESSESLTVRISQIESRLLDLDGIIDVNITSLNSGTVNVSLPSGTIPIRGVING